MSRVGHELHQLNREGLTRAMVATIWAVGVPLAAGILFLSVAAPHNPPLYLSALLTAAASLAAGALGARYQRNFSDLLLWNWVARLHAHGAWPRALASWTSTSCCIPIGSGSCGPGTTSGFSRSLLAHSNARTSTHSGTPAG